MTTSPGAPGIAGVVVAHIERWWRPLLVLLLAVEAALLAIAAYGRPFWHDEIFTLLTASLPLATLRDGYLAGVDLSLPLNTLATHMVHLTFGLGPITARLPAIVGFLTASGLTFALVRRRSNATVALGATMLLTGTLAWRYGTEARGYGLSLACAAGAWFGWVEAASGRRVIWSTAIMGLSLTAGLWTHHYFVLAFLPIAVGELVRQVGSRRFAARAWATMGLASLALVPLIPLIQVAAAQRTTFWARPQISAIALVYPEVLDRLARWPLALVPVAMLLWLPVRLVRRTKIDRRLEFVQEPVPSHEIAAALTGLAIPAAGVLLGFVTHAFAGRYVTFSTVALVVVTVAASWHSTPRRRGLDLSFLAMGALVLAATAWFTVTGTTRWRPADRHPLLVERLRTGQETAVAGSTAYIQFWYYAPSSERAHALYLADPAAELAHAGGNTIDLGYLSLARFSNLRVEPLQEFAATRARFMLYVIGSQWQEAALRSRGATLTAVARDSGGTLYDVQTKSRN